MIRTESSNIFSTFYFPFSTKLIFDDTVFELDEFCNASFKFYFHVLDIWFKRTAISHRKLFYSFRGSVDLFVSGQV